MKHSKTSDKKLFLQHSSEEKDTNKEAGEEELKKLKDLLQQRDNEISILCKERKIIFGFELIWLDGFCVRWALAV